jgi:single-strand DNA-binding protein
MYRTQREIPQQRSYKMYNRTLLIGRIGHNAEAKTDKNQQEYVVLSIATKDSWKNEQGDYESRTEWHRVYAWRNLSRFAKTLQKGQLISVDGQIRYREYAEDVNGTTVKHRVAEIHAYNPPGSAFALRLPILSGAACLAIIESLTGLHAAAAQCVPPHFMVAFSDYGHLLGQLHTIYVLIGISEDKAVAWLGVPVLTHSP